MSTGKRIYRPRELSRRQFLGLGAAGAGLLLVGCGGGGQNYGEGGGAVVPRSSTALILTSSLPSGTSTPSPPTASWR